ncbi:MAG: triose-phosphate isomerase [Buchnera aphidicola (Eriosoma harunire)]
MITKPLIIGNWKLHGNKNTIYDVFYPLIKFLKKQLINNSIMLLPPILYLHYAHKIIQNSSILLGAQNVDLNVSGAFTGETSINMLKDIGVNYILVGHSERRIYHQENNMIIAKKFKLIKDHNCIPILCIGETQEQKNNNQTKSIIRKQLNLIFSLCGESAFNNTIIAYEPVWSIGTGTIPNEQTIQNIHEYINNYIKHKYEGQNIDNNISIIYGGSVNKYNIKNILHTNNVDGVLIGKGSLDYSTFSNLIKLSHNE